MKNKITFKTKSQISFLMQAANEGRHTRLLTEEFVLKSTFLKDNNLSDYITSDPEYSAIKSVLLQLRKFKTDRKLKTPYFFSIEAILIGMISDYLNHPEAEGTDFQAREKSELKIR